MDLAMAAGRVDGTALVGPSDVDSPMSRDTRRGRGYVSMTCLVLLAVPALVSVAASAASAAAWAEPQPAAAHGADSPVFGSAAGALGVADPRKHGRRDLSGISMADRTQWYVPPRRMYSKRELYADRAVNFLGAGLSWPLALALCASSVRRGRPVRHTLAFAASGVGLIGMLNLSAAYHFLAWDWPYAQLLVSMDDSGISLMIMGSYTPLMVFADCYKCLALCWTFGILGFVMEAWKLQIRNEEGTAGEWTAFDFVNLVRYLAMGWAPVLISCRYLPKVLVRRDFVLIVAGGLLYTAGVPILLAGNTEFHLPIWHTFVLSASMCFYAVFWLLCHRAPMDAVDEAEMAVDSFNFEVSS